MPGRAVRAMLRRLVGGSAAAVVGSRSHINKVGLRNRVYGMHNREGVREIACGLGMLTSGIMTLNGAFGFKDHRIEAGYDFWEAILCWNLKGRVGIA